MLMLSRLTQIVCGGIGASTIRTDGVGDGTLLGTIAAGIHLGITVVGTVLAIGAGEVTGVVTGDILGITTTMVDGMVLDTGAVTMHGTDQAVVIRAFTPIVM